MTTTDRDFLRAMHIEPVEIAEPGDVRREPEDHASLHWACRQHVESAQHEDRILRWIAAGCAVSLLVLWGIRIWIYLG